MMNGNIETSLEEAVMPSCLYSTKTYLEGLRKTKKNSRQTSRTTLITGEVPNTITNKPRHSVKKCGPENTCVYPTSYMGVLFCICTKSLILLVVFTC
jgi:hypothetical protein